MFSLNRIQLDIALLFAAVCMEVYFETVAGLAGAGQFTRGLGRLLARIPGWQSALRAILLSSDDALQLVRLKKSNESEPDTPILRIEKTPAIILGLALLLLVIAPLILPIEPGDIPRIARAAFRPIPQ